MTLKTCLYQSHEDLGAKIVDFAGYLMPVQYKAGIIAEHNWTRNSCGIFDVSHMGQVLFEGDGLDELFSSLTPSNFSKVKDSVCKYTVLTNQNGGIIDDLIVTKLSSQKYFVVFNASRKFVDIDVVKAKMSSKITMNHMENRGLIAIQGPKTRDVIFDLIPQISELGYMKGMYFSHEKYGDLFVTRTGYTGEFGFEVPATAENTVKIWHDFLKNSSAMAIGLGARDSLRLEAGYPLYGNDLDEETTPVEAGISWVISKEHTSFTGSAKILKQLTDGALKKRVGIKLLEKGVLRHDYEIFSQSGEKISKLSSGGYSPTFDCSIGMAYIPSSYADSKVFVNIRGRNLLAEICDFSFYQAKSK